MHAVEMRGISKRFAGVSALENVDFTVERGEVHALLGENGAGKSTLMKILSGAYEPTSGRIVIGNREFKRLTPKQSFDNGISIIYQELSVINQLSIWENIYVGKMESRRRMGVPIVSRRAMVERTRELLEELDLDISPYTRVADLTISQKQMVEILKAVAFNARVIVMDEPTTSLSPGEVSDLFRIVNRLKNDGRSVIYISHKLQEVVRLADQVTVLKDGRTVGTRKGAEVGVDELVTMMVGRELKDKYLTIHEHDVGDREVILKVDSLTRKDGLVKDASFSLHRHEILGFSGLVGSGRTELVETVFGAAKRSSGDIELFGQKVRIKRPYDAIKLGLALLTENRRESGIFPNFTIRRNISIATEQKMSRLGGLWGRYSAAAASDAARNSRARFAIKCSSIEQYIGDLSGGNQQKALLGRWWATDARIFIFDEPTKGIDVGTKAEIYATLRELADSGVGVIVVSSELPELLSMCDRILVMARGRIVAEYAGEDATEEALVKSAAIGAI